MAIKHADFIRESTSTSGTGTLTLTALTGWARFSNAFSVGDTIPYIIENGNNRETGIGTIGAGNTLVRTTPQTTLVAGVYDNTTPTAITLVGNSFVSCGPVANNALVKDINNSIILENNSSSDALRITQTGTGNALVVEDSANPDSTPFVIDGSGKLLLGSTVSSDTSTFQTNNNSTMFTWVNNAYAYSYYFKKSRGVSPSAYAVLLSGDVLGNLIFSGDDGAQFVTSAQISAQVDGTPGTNDMPGRLVFSTTADGASSPTERVRIDSQGRVGIGSSPFDGVGSLYANRSITGNVFSYGVLSSGTVQSDVTSHAYYFRSTAATQATSFTATALSHFGAEQGTFGAGSTVTNQYGYSVGSSLIGATNNYGFYSNIASGTGRWNFYANGTADNFFGGPTTISVNSTSNALRITQTGAGNALVVEDSANPDATPFVVNASGQVCVGNASSIPYQSMGLSYGSGALQVAGADGNSSSQLIAQFNTGSAVAIPTLVLAKSKNATVGAHTTVAVGDSLGAISYDGSDGANFIEAARIWAQVDGTPGTNDMPGRLVFSTTADGASSPTERMRIDSSGNVLVKSAAGLGYGTGAGGTVMQVIGKGTGVTLNKPCGQITMHNQALAAGASVDFTLTNSLIVGFDILVAHAYAAGGKYLVSTTSVGTGSANIRVTNTTAGSLSEALVINFAIIKGASA